MDDQVDQKRMKPTFGSGKVPIPLKDDQSDSEEKEDYSSEPEKLVFLQPNTIHSHSPSSIPADKKELVTVSYQELPQPLQAHENNSATFQTYLSLYQRVLHKSMRLSLHHDHNETEDHHPSLCTIQQENHLTAVMCLLISHHQQ